MLKEIKYVTSLGSLFEFFIWGHSKLINKFNTWCSNLCSLIYLPFFNECCGNFRSGTWKGVCAFALTQLAFRGQIPGKSKQKTNPSMYLVLETILLISSNRNFIILKQYSYALVVKVLYVPDELLSSQQKHAKWKSWIIPFPRELFLSSLADQT